MYECLASRFHGTNAKDISCRNQPQRQTTSMSSTKPPRRSSPRSQSGRRIIPAKEAEESTWTMRFLLSCRRRRRRYRSCREFVGNLFLLTDNTTWPSLVFAAHSSSTLTTISVNPTRPGSLPWGSEFPNLVLASKGWPPTPAHYNSQQMPGMFMAQIQPTFGLDPDES